MPKRGVTGKRALPMKADRHTPAAPRSFILSAHVTSIGDLRDIGGNMKFIVALIAALLGGMLGVPADAQPQRGGTLTIALPNEPPHLNSAIDTTQQVKIVASKIYSGLARYDLNMNMQPDLALSWSVSADGRRITFNLRRDVKWHDGRDFTARDVEYSVMRGFGQNNGLVRAAFSAVERVETPDPHTAILVLRQPAVAIMNALPVATATILPAHLYDGADIRQNPANLRPVGTGPFRFVEWRRGSAIVLERNPNYFEEGRPYLDRIVFRVIPDTQARGAAVESGEVDMVFHSTAAASDARRLGALPHLNVTTDGYFFDSTVAFMEFNMGHPILGDARVRRALAHAVDRRFILDNIWMGFGRVASSPVHYALRQAHSDDVPQYPVDLRRAEQLLDEAGRPRGADGVRFRMTIDFVPFGDQYSRMAQYVRQQFAQIGVQAEVRNSDFATWVRRIWTQRDWDANMSAITNASDLSIGVQRAYWSQNIRPGAPFTNGTHFRNADVDRLFEAAAEELNPATRRQQFIDIQRILATELPVLPLVAIDQFTVVNRRVQNHAVLADGVYSSFADVWLTRR
jgi:peptide/nickel transport system substrate-binding protein